MSAAPTLELERSLLEALPAGALIAGMDEVGRGALAGPVAVGVAVVSASTPGAPSAVRDSRRMVSSASSATSGLDLAA